MHKRSSFIAGVWLLLGVLYASAYAQDLAIGHLRLVDRLDRPQDGYCLDILGVGQSLRTDLPIFAHNCKDGLTPDSAVTVTEKGEIRFVDVDLCVTAFGVNGRSLPGSPIILRACDGREHFFDSTPLQRFDWADGGLLMLRGTNLCLGVGDIEASTYSSHDRWRTLSVEACDRIDRERAVWEFVKLN